jgi:hypothetical protein
MSGIRETDRLQCNHATAEMDVAKPPEITKFTVLHECSESIEYLIGSHQYSIAN